MSDKTLDNIRVTQAELDLIRNLGNWWNEYLQLPKHHDSEGREVEGLVHALQDKIASRCVYRALNSLNN